MARPAAFGRRYFTKDPVVLMPVVCVLGMLAVGVLAVGVFIEEGNTGVLVIWIAYAIPAALLAVRSAKMGVFADDEGLTVVNTFKTTRVEWGDIRRIFVGRGFAWPGIYAALERNDGSVLPITAVGHPWVRTIAAAKRGRCGKITSELNVLLQQHRSDRSSQGQEGSQSGLT